MSKWTSFKNQGMLFENFRKYLEEDERAAIRFAQAPQEADLPSYVALLKLIAADPDFQAIAAAGKTDQAGEGDEVVSVKRGSVAAHKLKPTQAEIGFSNSLADQMKNAYGSTEAALGMKGEPIIMPSADQPPPAILVWNGEYILDGHHRWSQVMMTNPTGVVAIDSMTGPVLDSAEDALKMTQLAIAIGADNVVTKDFSGENLMETSPDAVYSFVYNNITDEVINLLRQAAKLYEDPDSEEAGTTDMPQQEPEELSEAAKRYGPIKGKNARMAAKYYTRNLKLIQKHKGKFSRKGGMPQAGKSGISQDKVNAILGTGVVNYEDPHPQDVKKVAESIKRRGKRIKVKRNK